MSRTSNSHGNRDARHLHLLNGVSFQPVFIIGDQRSGTTLLHRLLAETGCFNFVSAYHVIHYDQVLSDHVEGKTSESERRLRDEFDRLGLKNRIIDEVPATPDAPVEYGFIIGARAQRRRAMVTEDTLPLAQEICRKIQFVSQPGKPLLLKNPWDVMNFADLQKWFPDARFIFIHRHPASVMTSQLRAIRSLLEARNAFAAMLAPWYDRLFESRTQLALARWMDRPPFRLWERLVGLHTVRVSRYFLENIRLMAPEKFLSLRYEDLCLKPDEMMSKLLQFAVYTPQLPTSYQDKIQPRPPKVLPEIKRRYTAILDKLRPYLEFHGYEVEPNWLQGVK